ncbi:unnamed protein product [Urochloa decumbens]|uniref:F-box domain-containing protein n=1 Tax=Urochloa decumbens TaxID=240449 RepID=A0ABC9BTN3_9POAL
MSPSRTRAARDWAALPRDILVDVFFKLGPREIMMGAEFACKPWRSAALEEPTLWRRVDFEPWHPWEQRWGRVDPYARMEMLLVAVDRAKGQCEAFKGDCNDDFLAALVGSAPTLKSLHVEYSSEDNTEVVLDEALKKLTLLDDLEICFDVRIVDWAGNMLQSVCHACPRLKNLNIRWGGVGYTESKFNMEPIDNQIPVMHDLQTLKLYECDLSCWGLNSILDNCPQLETLYISGYFNEREMDKELRVKCARVKNLSLPTSAYDGYSSDDYCSQDEDYDSQDEDDDSELE